MTIRSVVNFGPDPLAVMPGGRSIPYNESPEFAPWCAAHPEMVYERKREWIMKLKPMQCPSPEYLAMFEKETP